MRLTICGLSAAMLFAAGGGAAHAAAPELATTDQVRHELQAIIKLPDRTPFKVYDARLAPVLASPGFGGLAPLEQCASYLLAAGAKAGLEDYAAADRYMAKGASCPEMPKEAWNGWFDVALRTGATDHAVTALQTIIERYPDLLTDYNDRAVLGTIARVRALPGGPERQFRMLNALFDTGWKPSDPGIVLDRLWANLAASLADRGLIDRAARVTQRISHPWTLAYVRADKRFDALFDHGAPKFDPEAQSQIELEFRRKLVADHTDELAYVVDYADDLTLHHHPELALKMLDDAQARIAAAPKGKPAYTDLEEKGVWVKDYRRRALFELGRTDEGLALAIEAAGDKEQGSDNVSQVINLAEIYNGLGRPKDALDTLGLLKGGVSPYGLMQAEAMRAIACFQLADNEGMAKAIAYLMAHEADAPDAVVEPLMWAGDLDAVAAIYIARLNDPDRRLAALGDLQEFARPLHSTPAGVTLHQRWEDLRARPDLRAAVDKVGRINPIAYSFMDTGA